MFHRLSFYPQDDKGFKIFRRSYDIQNVLENKRLCKGKPQARKELPSILAPPADTDIDHYSNQHSIYFICQFSKTILLNPSSIIMYWEHTGIFYLAEWAMDYSLTLYFQNLDQTLRIDSDTTKGTIFFHPYKLRRFKKCFRGKNNPLRVHIESCKV